MNAFGANHRLANIIGTDPLKSQDGHKWPAAHAQARTHGTLATMWGLGSAWDRSGPASRRGWEETPRG